jgi:8-oxo-dGTP diphosphatase
MIDVVGAIVVRDGRLLLMQRPGTKDFSFTWECPGGKVESGETHQGALMRELREETDLEAKTVALAPVWRGEFQNEVTRADRRHIELFFYRIISFDRQVRPMEGQGFGWFRKHEVGALFTAGALAPGNARASEAILLAAFGK